MTLVADRPLAPEQAPTDYPNRLVIDVTTEDIARGVQDDEYICAFCLPLRRMGYSKAWVGYESVRPRGYADETLIYAHTPESLAWLKAFDSDKRLVGPAHFELEPC